MKLCTVICPLCGSEISQENMDMGIWGNIANIFQCSAKEFHSNTHFRTMNGIDSRDVYYEHDFISLENYEIIVLHHLNYSEIKNIITNKVSCFDFVIDVYNLSLRKIKTYLIFS